MATALNLPINEAAAPIELGGDLTTDVRLRQQRIAEITEMIHVSPSEILSQCLFFIQISIAFNSFSIGSIRAFSSVETFKTLLALYPC